MYDLLFFFITVGLSKNKIPLYIWDYSLYILVLKNNLYSAYVNDNPNASVNVFSRKPREPNYKNLRITKTQQSVWIEQFYI